MINHTTATISRPLVVNHVSILKFLSHGLLFFFSFCSLHNHNALRLCRCMDFSAYIGGESGEAGGAETPTVFCRGHNLPHFCRVINSFILPRSTHQNLKSTIFVQSLIDWVSNESSFLHFILLYA